MCKELYAEPIVVNHVKEELAGELKMLLITSKPRNDDDADVKFLKAPILQVVPRSSQNRAMGSCDGLMCLNGDPGVFALVNPALEEVLFMPPSPPSLWEPNDPLWGVWDATCSRLKHTGT